jgi:hypothetical protein
MIVTVHATTNTSVNHFFIIKRKQGVNEDDDDVNENENGLMIDDRLMMK